MPAPSRLLTTLPTRSFAMARPKITLYVDTVSPFAYEAYYILRVCVFRVLGKGGVDLLGLPGTGLTGVCFTTA